MDAKGRISKWICLTPQNYWGKTGKSTSPKNHRPGTSYSCNPASLKIMLLLLLQSANGKGKGKGNGKRMEMERRRGVGKEHTKSKMKCKGKGRKWKENKSQRKTPAVIHPGPSLVAEGLHSLLAVGRWGNPKDFTATSPVPSPQDAQETWAALQRDATNIPIIAL